MPTITERAKKALEYDVYVSPEQSLEYLQNPWNFQSFSKYVKRLAAEKGMEFNPRNLPDYLTPKEKRSIQGYFKRANQADQEGKAPKTNGIPRDLALKLCFAFQLNEEEASDFLRKGCATYSFNVRSAYEATCLYCILTKQPYETVLKLLGQYEEAAGRSNTENEISGTKVLQAVLEGANWESNEDFLNSFLIPNRANFTEYSKTTIQNYSILRSSLCQKIIEHRLKDYKYRNETEKFEVDELMHSLQRQISNLAEEDSDFADSAAKFSDWTQALDVLEDIQDLLWSKHPTEGRVRYAALLNDSVSSSELMGSTLFYLEEALTEKRSVMKNGKKRVVEEPQRTNSDSSLARIMDCFPNIKYLEEFERKREDLSKSEKIRKIIVLLFFMDRFYDLYFVEGIPEFRESQEYNTIYRDMDNLLIDCNLPVLYPADPFDWLILKSARAFLMLDGNEDADPVSYFNDVMELSFPAEKTNGLNDSWVLDESEQD